MGNRSANKNIVGKDHLANTGGKKQTEQTLRGSRKTITVTLRPGMQLKYRTGGIAMESVLKGASDVISGKAVVLDKKGRSVQPTSVVACQKCMQSLPQFADNQLTKKIIRAGSPIPVIDPGSEHDSFILMNGTKRISIIPKSMCCDAGQVCKHADASCGACCNNNPQLRQQWLREKQRPKH